MEFAVILQCDPHKILVDTFMNLNEQVLWIETQTDLK